MRLWFYRNAIRWMQQRPVYRRWSDEQTTASARKCVQGWADLCDSGALVLNPALEAAIRVPDPLSAREIHRRLLDIKRRLS